MTIEEVLQKCLNENLQQIVISGAKKESEITKIRLRPVLLRGELMFQASMMRQTQEIHRNYTTEELMKKIPEWMREFKQAQLVHAKMEGVILGSKKGNFTVKVKKITKEESSESNANQVPVKMMLSHNRTKNYILQEGRVIPYLVDLGVMTKEGRIVRSKYDKFRQINRFLEFIEDILPKLSKEREITILDFGCGKSYLTFAMYDYLHELKNYDVNIIGLDLKTDVIERCNRLSKKFGYEKLHFYQGDIADYEGVSQVDMVVTLHACDIATDYALAKAVAWDAAVILSVPCCQHELNRQIHNEIMEPILSYGILKERMAAILTDGLRAKLLEEVGYDTQILEFIDMEHTPKNLLIRAMRRTENKKDKKNNYRECMEFLHARPTLEKLLVEQGSLSK